LKRDGTATQKKLYAKDLTITASFTFREGWEPPILLQKICSSKPSSQNISRN
jgi:hypothetical protein